jgi:filamentous hemagglutinin family protein
MVSKMMSAGTGNAANLALRAQSFTQGWFAGVGRGMGWSAALAGALIGSVCAKAIAGPEGAQVVRGQVSISRNGADTLIRAGNNSIINYRSFDIARGESVRFVQPNASSRVLNRINSSAPTRIDGSLLANGRVYMVNPAGVIFGQSAVVNVGGLYAAAGKLSNTDFLRGIDRFTDLSGQVSNYGTLTADFVTLAGSGVANAGQIISPQGTVVMASGEDVMVGERSGNLFVKIQGSAAPQASAGAAVENTGSISAARVRMGAGDMYSIAVRNAGRIKSKDVRIEGQGTGEVHVSGEIDASSPTGRGGQVRVLGEKVGVTDATINASGATGGGTVLIGGNFQGRGPEQNADRTFVGSTTRIDVSATDKGNAGTAIVWADDITRFHGEVRATGGAQGGDGGFVEVSGKHNLAFTGKVDTRAANGRIGTLLLDPDSITVQTAPGADDSQMDADTPNPGDPADVINFADGGATDFVIGRGTIQDATTNVILQANVDITVNTAITMSNDGVGIIMQAGDDIILNNSITTRGGQITLTANDNTNSTASGDGRIQISDNLDTTGNDQTGGNVTLTVSGGTGAITLDGNVTTRGGTVTLAGPVTLSGATRTIDATDGGATAAGAAVAFNTTVDGGSNLVVDAGTGGNITFSGAAGGTTALNDVTLTGNGVSLGALSTAASGDVSVTNGAGFTIGGTWSLGGTLTQGGGGTVNIGGSVTTSNDNITLADDATVTAASATLDSGTGTTSVGAIDVGSNALTLRADNMAFTGGNDSIAGAGSVLLDVSTAARVINIENGATGLDISAASMLVFDAALGSLTIGSTNAGDITVGGATTLNGNTTLITGDDFDNTGAITATQLAVQAADALTVTSNITASTSLSLHSGTDGTGNTTFNNIVVDSPSISLRAGSGAGSTAFVDAATSTPTFQNGGGANPTSFSFRQDATVFESQLPGTLQWGAGDATGITITVQSDGGNVDLSLGADPTQLDNSALTLITSGANRSRILSDLALASLSVTGNATVSANVTTPGGTVSFGGPVTLGASVTIDTTNGGAVGAGNDITFSSTVDGTTASSQGLTVRAGTGGNVTHTGAVGGTTQLAAYSITSANDFDAAAVTATSFTQVAGTGTTTITGRLTANGAGGVNLTGNAFALSGGVDTATGGGFTITNAGTATISGGASGRLLLDGAFSKTGAGDIDVGVDINTTDDNISFSTGTLTMTAAATFGADTATVTLNTTDINGQNLTLVGDGIDFAAGAVSITGTGAGTLTLQGATNATSIGVAGGAGTLDISTTDLAALADEAVGSLVIGAASGTGTVTVAGGTFRDAVTFRSPTSGTVAVTGLVTGSTADASVTFSASTITLGADVVTAGAAINVGTDAGHAARLDASVLLDTTDGGNVASGASVAFAGTLNALAAGTQGLTIDAGTGGNVTHTGAVGGTAALGAYTLTNADDFTATGAVTVASFTQTAGQGTSTFNGLLTANGTPGDINISGAAVTFNAGVTTLNGGILSVTNSGALTIANTALSLDGAFTKAGAGNTVLGANITTSNDDITFGGAGAVSLTAASTLSAGTGTISVGAADLDGQNFTLAADEIDFTGGANTVVGNGSGNLTLRGGSAGTSIGVLDAASTLELSASDLSALADEAAGAIIIGGAGVSGDITVGSAVSFRDGVTLQTSGAISIAGAITGSNADSSVSIDGGTVGLAANITTQGAAVSIAGATTLSGDATIDTTNAGGAATGANISITSALDSSAAGSNTLTLESGSTGDISLEAVGATTRLGGFEILGADNVSTQGIRATVINNTAAGTATYSGALDTTGLSGITLSGAGSHDLSAGATTTGGGVFIADASGSLTVGASGLSLDGSFTRSNGTTSLAGDITTSNDDINFSDVASTVTLTGDSVLTAGTGTITLRGVAMGSQNLTLGADGIDLLGGNDSVTGAGTGTLMLRGGSDATTIGLAGGAGTLQLTQTDLDAVAVGAIFEMLIGSATGTGDITIPVGGVVFNNDVRFLGDTASLVVNGPITFASPTGCLTFDLAVDLGTDLTAACIVFNDALTITAAGVDLSVGTGNIDFNSTVDVGAFGFSAVGDDINFAGGADSLTGTGAGIVRLAAGTVGDIRMGAAGSGLVISTTDLAAFADGFGSLVIGNSSDANTITLGAATYRDPVRFETTGAGSINVTGAVTGTGDASFAFGGATNLGADVSTAGGDIDLEGTTLLNANVVLGAGTGTVTASAGLGLDGNDLTIAADAIDFAGGADSVGGDGTGTLTLLGSTAATTIGVGGGSGTLQIDDTDLAALADGVAGQIVIGQSIGTADVTVGSSTFRDAVVFRTGSLNSVIFGSLVTGATSDASVTAEGGAAFLFADIVTLGGAVNLDVATTRLAASVSIDTTSAGGATAGGDITFGGAIRGTADGSQGLVLNAGTGGGILITGAVGSTRLAGFTVLGAATLSTQGVRATFVDSTVGTSATYAGLLDTSGAGGIGLHGAGTHTLSGGAATTGGGGLTADGAGLLTINTAALSLDGAFDRAGGATSLGAGITTTGDAVSFGGDVTVTSDLAISTVAGGNVTGATVTFSGATNGDAAGRDLSIDAGTAGTVTFGGDVGATQALGSLTAVADTSTTSIFLQNVITTGGQSYTGSLRLAGDLTNTGTGDMLLAGPVELTSDASIINSGAAGDDVSITGEVTSDGSARGLTLGGAGNLGNITLFAAAGSPNALSTLTAVGATISVAGVTTTGTQSYTGNLVANGDLAGTSISVTGNLLIGVDLTVDASTSFAVGGTTNSEATEFNDLTVNSPNISFTGAVGGVDALGAITTDAGGSLALGGGSVTTRDGQTWGENITLGAGTIFTSTSGGDIRFNGTVNSDGSARDLIVNTSGASIFTQALGNTSALSDFETDAGGTSTFSANVTAGSSIEVGDSAVLGANVLFTAPEIEFEGTIDSDGTARDLSLNGSSSVILGGNVGANSVLSTLAITSPSISLRSVSTTGTQNYGGSVALNGALAASGAADVVMTGALALGGDSSITSGGGNINISGEVNSITTPFALTLNAGVGDVILGSDVGTGNAANQTRLASFSATGDAITLRNVRTSGLLSITGATVSLNGNLTAADTGPIAIAGALTLLADTQIVANSGAVQFGGTINSDGTARALTVTAGGSEVLFSSGVGTSSALSTLTLAATSARFDVSDSAQRLVRTNGDQTINAGVLLGSDMTFAGNDLTFGGTINSADATPRALTINTNTVSGDTGVTTFSSAIGAVNALLRLNTNTEGLTMVGANITTTSGMTFADPLRLTGNAVLDGGAGALFFRSTIETDAGAAVDADLTLLTTLAADADTIPIKFGGNIGVGRRLRTLTIGADRATPQTAATAVMSDGFDASGVIAGSSFQIADSYTINTGTGGFVMGRGQKLTALGRLSILTSGAVVLSDLTALGDMTVRGTSIAIKLRPGGTVFDNIFESPDQAAADLSVDFVAAGEISFIDLSSTLITPTVIAFGDAREPTFATNSGNRPVNLNGFNFLQFTDVNGVLSSAFFVDPRSGNGGRLLGLDIIAKGPPVDDLATSIAGAIPRDTESRENAPPVTISAALREPLQEMGISVRDLEFTELVEYLVGRAFYRDLPGKPSPRPEDIRVTVNRLASEPVQALIAAYRGLLYKETTNPDGSSELVPNQDAVRTFLEDAWNVYAEEAGDQASGKGFAAWLSTRGASASSTEREAARIFDGIRDVLEKISALGLSPAEARIPRDRLLGELKPQSMTDEQMLDAIQVEAEPLAMR